MYWNETISVLLWWPFAFNTAVKSRWTTFTFKRLDTKNVYEYLFSMWKFRIAPLCHSSEFCHRAVFADLKKKIEKEKKRHGKRSRNQSGRWRRQTLAATGGSGWTVGGGGVTLVKKWSPTGLRRLRSRCRHFRSR